MTRILVFIEPKPLPEHLFRNRSWLQFPLDLASYLVRDRPGEYEVSLAAPKRFMQTARPYFHFLVDRVFPIDEVAIAKEIFRDGFSLRDVWNHDFLGTIPLDLRQRINQQIQQAVPSEKWDLVLSFGEPCRYGIADGAVKINMETTSFGRSPFEFGFFLDHLGLFRESAPSHFFFEQQSVELCPLVREIQRRSWQTATDQAPIRFKKKFDHYLLLPLQASNYSSFDAQVPYQTQLDYLIDVCAQVPGDVGIVVTEHPEVCSIDTHRNFVETCQGLQAIFPNVVHLPRAKFFPSSSLALLPQVDAVWTAASNVGAVASFWNLPLGTPADSHLNYIADAHSIDGLLQLLGRPEAAGDESERKMGRRLGQGKAVFDWMFRHYLIPWQVARRPQWMAKMLTKRLDAIKASPDSLGSFSATNLSANDFLIPDSDQPFAASSHHLWVSHLNLQVDRYRNHQAWRAKQVAANGGQRTFMLLNDTAKLETYRHLGCNHVGRTIQTQMQKHGFSQLGAFNQRSECPAEAPVPEWVIVNGEGSFHHNSPRIEELLGMAAEFKQQGAKVAVINCLWEANAAETASWLKQFDLVAVRDTRSHDELAKIGVASHVIPDLSLPGWQTESRNESQTKSHNPVDTISPQRLVFTDCIVYPRSLALFDAMLRFGGQFVMLDDRQISRMNGDGCFAALAEKSQTVRLLESESMLNTADLVVAGRFHVAVACIALGIPFVYVDSNTGKITALCEDVGLPPELLNVTSLVEEGDWSRLAARFATVGQQFGAMSQLISNYRQRGCEKIDYLFSSIADQAAPAKPSVYVLAETSPLPSTVTRNDQ